MCRGCLGIAWRNVLSNRTVLALSGTVKAMLCHQYSVTGGGGKFKPGSLGGWHWNFCITRRWVFFTF